MAVPEPLPVIFQIADIESGPTHAFRLVVILIVCSGTGFIIGHIQFIHNYLMILRVIDIYTIVGVAPVPVRNEFQPETVVGIASGTGKIDGDAGDLTVIVVSRPTIETVSVFPEFRFTPPSFFDVILQTDGVGEDRVIVLKLRLGIDLRRGNDHMDRGLHDRAGGT